jgi:hypothetical protein
MPLVLSILVALATGLIVLGWSGTSLLAWTHGYADRLPLDRDDAADLRLAKAGVDVTWGALPVIVAFALLLRPGAAAAIVPQSVLLASLGLSCGYLALYFLYVRLRLARYRLALMGGRTDAAAR